MTEKTEQVVEPGSLPASTPRGWYSDPFDRARSRWWDGHQWTAYASQSGATVTTDPDPSLPDPESEEPDRHRALLGLATVVLLVVAAFLPFRCGGEDDNATDDGAGSASVGSTGSEEQVDSAGQNPEVESDGVEGEIPDGLADGETLGSGGADDQSGGLVDAGSGGGSYWDDPNDPSRGRLRVVYLVEVNDGQEFERIIASDDPRQMKREPDFVDYHDDERAVQCFDGSCQASDFNGGSIRRFTVFTGVF